MVTDKSRKHLPPYISYRTFRNFVDGLQQRMPSRIDRSYWGDMLSGSTGTQLMAALRFLGLVDANSKPTARLKALVPAKGEQRAELLREIASEGFSFVLQSSLDSQNATYAQLDELFNSTFQVAGDVRRKCIKFFIELASDAKIPLSPFMTRRTRPVHIKTGTKTAVKRTGRNQIVPPNLEEVPDQVSWTRTLLTKFPTFDPTWSDEVKLKWFAAFDELLKQGFIRSAK
jgi:hypothetical protein